MTGICGWAQLSGRIDNQNEMLAGMLSGLSGSGNDALKCIPGHGLGIRSAKPSIGTSSDQKILAVIEGSPRWHSSHLQQIAREHCNSRALAIGYAESGRTVLGQLSGTFSLCVIDIHRSRTLLAVDRMGIRSMSYAHDTATGLIYGSTISAILASNMVSRTISPQSLYDYFFFHVIPSPATVYTAISKLEPAQYLELHNGIVSTGFYWRPIVEKVSKNDSPALQAELRSRMRESVLNCTPDEYTGAFLSGGLDSSTVNGIASELVEGDLSSFSIGFDQEAYNEIEYARIAAKQFGLNLTEYFVTPADVEEVVDRITDTDEPFGNSSVVPAYFCALRASEAGMKKMLAGDGGDELFAGNERYAKQRVFELYWRIPALLRRNFIEALVFRLPMNWSMPSRKLRRYVEQAMVAMPDRLFTYTYLYNVDPSEVFDQQFLELIDSEHPLESARSWYSRNDEANIVDKMLFFDWKLTLADNDLRKVNIACDMAGIDVAYPMLDDALVDFSLRVPAHDKITPYNLRAFFKKSYRGFLPSEIIHKKKHGFGLPFGEWLVTSPVLKRRVHEGINQLKSRNVFRPEFLTNIQILHEKDHASYYGNLLWVLFILEEWLSKHDEIG